MIPIRYPTCEERERIYHGSERAQRHISQFLFAHGALRAGSGPFVTTFHQSSLARDGLHAAYEQGWIDALGLLPTVEALGAFRLQFRNSAGAIVADFDARLPPFDLARDAPIFSPESIVSAPSRVVRKGGGETIIAIDIDVPEPDFPEPDQRELEQAYELMAPKDLDDEVRWRRRELEEQRKRLELIARVVSRRPQNREDA